jgi:hypothetical protein
VTEERHHTTGGLVNAPLYPLATQADRYANLSLDYKYKEGFKYECCTGREEGYHHVVDNEEMEEGKECNTNKFAKLGLDCCLMLDNNGHNAKELEVVASSALLRLLAGEQSNASAITIKEEEGREEEGGRRRRSVIGNRSNRLPAMGLLWIKRRKSARGIVS